MTWARTISLWVALVLLIVTVSGGAYAQVTLTVSPTSVPESAGQTTVIVTGTLDEGARTTNTVVTVSVSGETASSGDFEAVPDFLLTIVEGGTSGTATFTLTPINNSVYEGDKTLTVSGTDDSNSEQPLSVDGTSVTIVDDETAAAKVTLSVNPPAVGESDGRTTMTVTGTLDGAARTTNTIVTVSVGAGTAEASDFAAIVPDPFELTISAGQTSGTATFTLTPESDSLDEDDETLSVTGTATDLAVTGTTATIVDDDTHDVELSVSALSVPEGGSSTYMVVLTGAPGQDVIVTPSSSDDSIVRVSPSSLRFDSSNWDEEQTVTVSTAPDADTADDVATITHAVSGLGDVTDGGSIAVTVESGIAEKAALTDTLAAVTSAAVSNATTNIGARFSAARGGTNLSVAGQSFAQSLHLGEAAWSSLWDNEGYSRTLGSEDLLRSTAFQIALGAAEGEQGQAATQWTVWGRGDLQYFSSDPDRGSGYDGDLRAGYLGLDVQIDERWLAGIALSQTMASADYTLDGNGADGQGQMDVTLTSVLPYIRFAPDGQSELWAILGAGGGEIENIRPGAASSASETSDLSLWMASAGGRQALASEGPLGWALLGDMSFGRVETEDGVQAVSGLTVDTWRTRLGVEGSYTTELESGGSFTAFMEVAGRLDGGGDDDEEVGVEVSPGLYFSDPGSGFGVEVRGRALVLHSAENYEEYGMSATVSLSPRSDGLGLSLSLTPRWGDGTGGAETLWRNDAFGQLTSRSNDRHAMSLDTRVGYGVRTMSGVLTPFGEFDLRDGGSRTVRVGTSFGRYRFDPGALSLELSGEWRERASRDLEQRVGIVGRVRF